MERLVLPYNETTPSHALPGKVGPPHIAPQGGQERGLRKAPQERGQPAPSKTGHTPPLKGAQGQRASASSRKPHPPRNSDPTSMQPPTTSGPPQPATVPPTATSPSRGQKPPAALAPVWSHTAPSSAARLGHAPRSGSHKSVAPDDGRHKSSLTGGHKPGAGGGAAPAMQVGGWVGAVRRGVECSSRVPGWPSLCSSVWQPLCCIAARTFHEYNFVDLPK